MCVCIAVSLYSYWDNIIAQGLAKFVIFHRGILSAGFSGQTSLESHNLVYLIPSLRSAQCNRPPSPVARLVSLGSRFIGPRIEYSAPPVTGFCSSTSSPGGLFTHPIWYIALSSLGSQRVMPKSCKNLQLDVWMEAVMTTTSSVLLQSFTARTLERDFPLTLKRENAATATSPKLPNPRFFVMS